MHLYIFTQCHSGSGSGGISAGQERNGRCSRDIVYYRDVEYSVTIVTSAILEMVDQFETI